MNSYDQGANKDRIVDMQADRNRFLPPGLSQGRGQVTQNGFVAHKKRKGVKSAQESLLDGRRDNRSLRK